MALQRKYDELFEKHVWGPYPKWPVGRSNKVLAYEKYLVVKKQLALTVEDHIAIEHDIEQRKRTCASWQKGSKFGPPSCQKYVRQMLWNEPYEKVKGEAEVNGEASELVAVRRLGYASLEDYYAGRRMH